MGFVPDIELERPGLEHVKAVAGAEAEHNSLAEARRAVTNDGGLTELVIAAQRQGFAVLDNAHIGIGFTTARPFAEQRRIAGTGEDEQVLVSAELRDMEGMPATAKKIAADAGRCGNRGIDLQGLASLARHGECRHRAQRKQGLPVAWLVAPHINADARFQPVDQTVFRSNLAR